VYIAEFNEEASQNEVQKRVPQLGLRYRERNLQLEGESTDLVAGIHLIDILIYIFPAYPSIHIK